MSLYDLIAWVISATYLTALAISYLKFLADTTCPRCRRRLNQRAENPDEIHREEANGRTD